MQTNGYLLLKTNILSIIHQEEIKMKIKKSFAFFHFLLLTVSLICILGDTVFGQLADPVVLRHINLSSYANANEFIQPNTQWGDLNNDGVYTDFIRYSNSKRMQAFAYNGGTSVTLLWDYSAPVQLPNPPTDYQYKYVIWDVDNDGRTEVIGPFASSSGFIELRILDGQTGVVKRSITTTMPNPTSSDNILEWRIYVTVANFRGLPSPRDIVLLNEYDSYGDIWVYDDNLNLLWNTTNDNATKTRIYAHFPYTADIDNDGKDELIGTWVFDDNGTKLWRVTPPEWEQYDYFYDHLDRAFFGEMDPSRPGKEILVSHEFYRAKLYDTSGNLYWQSAGGSDSKISAIGELSAAYVGTELCIWDNSYKGKTHLFDINGTDVKTVARVLDGYQMDYDGDRSKDEIFSPNDQGMIYDPFTNSRIFVSTFIPWNTTPMSAKIYANSLDVLGDYREEIVVMDEDEMVILGCPGTAPGNYPTPWVDGEYRYIIANKQDDIHPEKMFFNWRKSWGGGTVPNAPSNLTATAVSSSQINLAWTDNSSDETGFKIERSNNGTNFTQIDIVGANVSSYSNTGLAASTTYYYRVCAYNASGNSGYTNVASATTQSGGGPVDNTATGDITVAGTITGSYINTQISDNNYESIQEILSGGKPANRYSYLEHKWTINVTGGTSVNFYLEAYKSTSSDGDNFVFAYSTDNINYTNMLTVTKTSDDGLYQTYSLPGTLNGTVYIRVIDTDRTAGKTSLDNIFIDHMFIRSESGLPKQANAVAANIPAEFQLYPNYPNPFNPETQIKYVLSEQSLVKLTIYNSIGQEVRTLVDGIEPAGSYLIRWNGLNDFGQKVSSGIYFYRLSAGNFVSVKKMSMLK